MTLRTWSHGLGAALISGFADAFILHLAAPETFNATPQGVKALLLVCLLKAGISVALYLKQSPLPD